MRTRHLAAILTVPAILALTAPGLAGCSEAKEKAREQVRASCDRAVKSAEDSGAVGRAGTSKLSEELSSNIDEKYRGPMEEVAKKIPAEAAKRGISDGVNKAVPPEQREEWHDMAVDVCTDQVVGQLNLT